MKRLNARLDKIEAKLEPKKEMKFYVHKIPIGETYPNDEQLQKIKEENGADLLIVVSVDGRGSEYNPLP